MNKIHVIEFFKSNWLWIIIIGYFTFLILKYHKDNIDMENSGVTVSVTVEYHSRESLDRAGVIKTISIGYYYINDQRYRCHTVGVFPIGSTFKIKYNPKNPEEWQSVKK